MTPRQEKIQQVLQELRPVPPGLTCNQITRYLHGPGWTQEEWDGVQQDLAALVRADVVTVSNRLHFRLK